MSKNIKLNDKNYNGISTVQLPTTDGGTATFKDTDEITTPTGTKTITENGTYDVTAFAQAIVNVASSGGSVDMESGTFTGTGARIVTITTKKKCSNVIIYNANLANEDFDVATYAPNDLMGFVAIENVLTSCGGVNYNSSRMQASFERGTYAFAQGSNQPLNTCEFYDKSIEINNVSCSGAVSTFVSGNTYNWLAW